MAVMLSRENSTGKATTTICHKYTRDLTAHTIGADILIVAAGQPNLIKAEMVKQGVVIIDVGINRIADETLEKGYRLVGDVDFDSVRKKLVGLHLYLVEWVYDRVPAYEEYFIGYKKITLSKIIEKG